MLTLADYNHIVDNLERAGYLLAADAPALARSKCLSLLQASVADLTTAAAIIAYFEAMLPLAVLASPATSECQKILLALLCLKAAWPELYEHFAADPPLQKASAFFDDWADPAFYPAAWQGGRKPIEEAAVNAMTLFMQSFKSLIEDTGHVITAGHLAVLADLLRLTRTVNLGVAEFWPEYDAARWLYRRRNYRIIKAVNAQLRALFPDCSFHIFQNIFEADGALAVNAAAFYDFTAPSCRFTLDCRLETALAGDHTAVILALFSRHDQQAFRAVFDPWVKAQDAVFIFDGRCWLNHVAAGLPAGDEEVLTNAAVTALRELIPRLPLS